MSTMWYICIILCYLLKASCSDIPHVNDCNFCFKCIVGDKPADTASRQLQTVNGVNNGKRNLLNEDSSLGISLESNLHSRKWFTPLLPFLPKSRSLLVDIPNTQTNSSTASTRFSSTDSIRSQRPPKPPSRSAPPPRPPRPPTTPHASDLDPNLPIHLRASSYFISQADALRKQGLPNCTVCYGCNMELQSLSHNTTFNGAVYVNERGATSSWLFKVKSNKTADGIAVVKVYCVPVPKVKKGRAALCSPPKVLSIVRLMYALELLSEECGFSEILPKVWFEPINAVIPDVGYHIRWYGIFMTYAPGISLENFLHKGTPRADPGKVLELMHRLNSTQIVMAALFDLLTSQCDRHAQNILVSMDGSIRLIDQEASLQNTWRNCGFDSVFVPTSQKQEIMRLTNAFVQKLVNADLLPKEFADTQLLLDYRCYVPGENLGTNYPPQLKQCLARIRDMGVNAVREHYELPDNHTAHVLWSRAKDMINIGYERTVKEGWPTNMATRLYRFQPKCCKIRFTRGLYRCAHHWPVIHELPRGNPITGRDWHHDRPDIGTYNGGDWDWPTNKTNSSTQPAQQSQAVKSGVTAVASTAAAAAAARKVVLPYGIMSSSSTVQGGGGVSQNKGSKSSIYKSVEELLQSQWWAGGGNKTL